MNMEFEWDDSKSEACYTQRGFDFAYAAQAFFDPHRWVRLDQRYSYGEDRFQLLAKMEPPPPPVEIEEYENGPREN
jgi:uncharacterized DUF497 family protein